DRHRHAGLDVLGVGAKDVEVDPELREIGDLEQRRALTGQAADRGTALDDDAGDRRGDAVGAQAQVALDRRQCLAGADLVPDVGAQRTDRARETGGDLRNTTLDRGQQALHLMLVGDHAGAGGLGLDTGLFRYLRRRGRAGDFLRVMPAGAALGSVLGGLVVVTGLRRLVWLATAGCEERGQREYRDQVDRLHGVAPWLSCGPEPATNAWPVS